MPRLEKLSIRVSATFRLGDHDDPGEDRGRLAGPSSWMTWIGLSSVAPSPTLEAAPPVIKAAFSAITASSSRGFTAPSACLEPRRGFSSAWASDTTSTPGSLEARDVGEIGPKLALDHDQAIGGKLGDARAERFLDVGGIYRQRGGADRRIDFGQQRAEVGVFPGLDAAMRQPEPAISLDRLVAASQRRMASPAPGSASRALSNVSR